MESLKSIQNQLFGSIYGGEEDEVKRILSYHPELTNLRRINEDTQEESTPLIEACRHGLNGVVKILLDKGADVSATGNLHSIYEHSTVIIPLEIGCSGEDFGAMDDVFPLFAAAEFHDEETIMMALLSAGADVNQRTAIGQTALHITCTHCDEGHGAEEFSLDDDDYAQDITNMGPIRILLDHGADVNICDHNLKSPLHYAVQNGNKYFVKILIEKGANVYLKDSIGLTALDYAATIDKLLTLALIDKYSFPLEQIIQAYECVAWNAHCDKIDSSMLQKATLLRQQHGIPKAVLPPLEFYGFQREWQTIEELEEYGDDFDQLLVPCLLARERVSKEIQFDLVPEVLDPFSNSGNAIDKENNLRMRHWIDRVSYFGKYLHFSSSMIMGEGVSLKRAMDYEWSLSNDVLVKFALVAIDSCCVIQNRQNRETKPGCIQELVSTMEQILVVIGGVMLHLIKRNFHEELDRGGKDLGLKVEISYRIAKILLEELLHRCPMVSSPFHGYTSPVINILFKSKYDFLIYTAFTEQCFKFNYQLAKMITESHQCDLNATDCDGNTILHIVMFDFLHETNLSYFSATMEQHVPTAMEIIRILLEKGCYPHARNKQGKCPADVSHYRFLDTIPKPDSYIGQLRDLLMKYDSSLSLKYLAARQIVDSEIPYRNQLPNDLVKFVDLH